MANLTRIKNNQITDSSIWANAKIIPGSIVGSLFNNNITVTSDFTITGNLTVQGASTYLTVASTNTYVNDPLIALNNAFSGTNTYDLGFVFNRGTLQNQAVVWNEANKEFRLVGTTETGTTYGTINESGFANLHVGNLTVQYDGSFKTISTTGALSGDSLNVSGNVDAATVLAQLVTSDDATFGNVTAGFVGNTGTAFTGASINLTGNVSANTVSAYALSGIITTASQTNITSVGTLGSLNVTGNVSANNINAYSLGGTLTTASQTNITSIGTLGSLNVTGNILSAGAVHNALTVNGTGTFSTVNAATIGNAGAVITGTTGEFSGNVIGGLAQFAAINATAIGNATPSTGVFTTATAGAVNAPFIGNTGAVFTGASLNVTGNILSAGAVHNALTVNGTGAFTTLTASGNVIAGLAQFAAVNSTPIGNASASTGKFTTLTSSDLLATRVTFAGTAGVLTDNAGLTFSANTLTVGGSAPITINGGTATIATTTTDQNLILAPNGTGAVDFNGAAATNLADPVGLTDAVTLGYLNGTFSGAISALNSDDSDFTLTDNGTSPGVITANVDAQTALTITANNLGVFGDTSTTAKFYVDRTNSNVVVNSALYVTTSVKAQSVSTGALTATGATSLNLTTATAINNTPIGNATPSTGVFTTATAGAVNAPFIGNTGAVFTGASLNASGNVLATTVNASTVNASGNVLANTVSAYALSGIITTASQTNITAVGTLGSLNVTGNVLGEAATFSSAQINGNETVTGYLNVAGNILASTGALNSLVLNDATNATALNTGALQVAGGASISKDLWVGGNVYAQSITGTVANILTVGDPLLYLSTDNVYPYNFDIGVYSHFIGGVGNVYQHSGFVRDDSDGYWKLFSNVSEPVAGQVTFDSGTIYDGLKAGNLNLVNTTASTSTGTGALIVVGGAGIGGAVTAGSFNTAGNVLASTVGATTIGASTVNAGTVNAGIIGNTGAIITGASLNVSGNVLASSITTGTLSIQSIAIPGNLIAGLGQFAAINSTPIGNATPSTGVFTTATAGAVTAPFIGNTGAVFTGASINLSGNVDAATVLAQLVTSDDATFGNVTAGFVGNTGTAFTGASLNISGNVSANTVSAYALSGIITTASQTNITSVGTLGSLNVTGNILSAGAVHSSLTVNGTGAFTTLTATGNVIGGLGQFAALNATPIGNATPSTGVFTTATAGAVSSGFIGNTGTAFTGDRLNVSGNVMATVFSGGKLTVTAAGSATTGNGQIFLNGATSNRIDWAAAGTGAPAFTTRSDGTKVVLYPSLSSSTVDYAIGVDSATLWSSVPENGDTFNFKWYGAETLVANLSGTGNFTTVGGIRVNATTSSTTATNGALVVAGAVGIGGNVILSNTSNLIVGGSAGTTGQVLVATGTGAQWQTLSAIANKIFQNASNVTVTESYVNVAVNGSSVATFSSTGLNNAAVGVTTASTGKFTTLQATSTVTLNNYTGYVKSAAGSGISASSTIPNTDITGLGSMSTQDSTSVSVSGGSIDGTTIGSSTAASGKFTTITGTTTTDTTGVGTGAVQIAGGADIAKSLYVNDGAVINGAQGSKNFQVKGAGTTSLIYTNGADGTVTLGGSNTASIAGSTVKINGTDSLMLPKGPTAARPSNSGNVDVEGMIRFNTSLNDMEYYTGTGWTTPGATISLITDQQFSGDGSSTQYSLTANSATNSAMITINGVTQVPTLAYAVSGKTITFTEAPAAGDVIDVRILTISTSLSTLASSNGCASVDVSDGNNNYANLTVGLNSATVRLSADAGGNLTIDNGTKLTYQQTGVPVTTSPTTIDSFSLTAFRAAKYLVTFATFDSAYHQVSEVLVIHDDTTATLTEYGIVSSSGSPLANFTVTISGGMVLLKTAAVTATGNVKAMTTYIRRG